jgi:hypothetical protein
VFRPTASRLGTLVIHCYCFLDLLACTEQSKRHRRSACIVDAAHMFEMECVCRDSAGLPESAMDTMKTRCRGFITGSHPAVIYSHWSIRLARRHEYSMMPENITCTNDEMM